ncbi:MAG: phospholipid carrier-dependent glycosyltransferase [Turicibacter sp.]|nr:phospholipid carrier-dependent glycosyltransferase [Turicibacter sp.]
MLTFWLTTISLLTCLALLYIWQFQHTSFYKKHHHLVVCLMIMAIYGTYAFINLGNFSSPQSLFIAEQAESVQVEILETTPLSYLQFMTGPRNSEAFRISFSEAGVYWTHQHVQTGEVFAWDYITLSETARFIRLTPTTGRLHLLEMGFRDEQFELATVVNVDQSGALLFDEQQLVPTQLRDVMHSAYFDEIYYPRAAYEFLHQMDVNEWTHPPLGKVIQSWSISLFGMTPFAWRLPGVIAGLLTIPLLYALAKALFKEMFWASFATLIFAFDFMPFVQSRLATLDSYMVLFILGMFYFMYRYTQLDLLDEEQVKQGRLFLALSGVFTGLALATKWSGFYGGLGIFILFVFAWIKQTLRVKKNPALRSTFYPRFWLTGAWCVCWFILIPLVIYVLSYVPFERTGYLYPELSFLGGIIQNQRDMWHFHLHLDATHPYSSYWWQWIINWRPMFYFENTLPNGLVQGISSFGNPLVWWAGIPAALYTSYRALLRRDRIACCLILGYLVFLLPWLGFTRVAFIYYYYPNVVFLTLMIAYSIKEASLFDWLKINRQPFAAGFVVATVFLFLLFYPVLAGVPVHPSYVETFLRWPFMRGWVLIL